MLNNPVDLGFDKRFPTHQNAVDLFSQTWVSAFPATSGLTGGTASHFNDARVTWAASVLGGLNGLSILELGPFEAYNTYQFQQAGAGTVLSIESSHVNFVKCLVVQNIFSLRATFLLGDFQEYLATTKQSFDVCWASGVLYHMTEPVELLEGISRISNTVFIWTQYYDAAHITGEKAAFFDSALDREIQYRGRLIKLHYRSYLEIATASFSGGADQYSYWLEKNDILYILSELGYSQIDIGIDNPEHPPGPAMFFLARTV